MECWGWKHCPVLEGQMVVRSAIGVDCSVSALRSRIGASSCTLLGHKELVQIGEQCELLPAKILLEMAVVFVSELAANRDTLSWGMIIGRQFSVSFAYNLSTNGDLEPEWLSGSHLEVEGTTNG